MVPEQEIATKEKQQVQGSEQTRPGRYFMPDVDIREYDDVLRLWADMPGVADKDVDVMLRDGVLTITGTVSTAAYEKLAPLIPNTTSATILGNSLSMRRSNHQGSRRA